MGIWHQEINSHKWHNWLTVCIMSICSHRSRSIILSFLSLGLMMSCMQFFFLCEVHKISKITLFCFKGQNEAKTKTKTKHKKSTDFAQLMWQKVLRPAIWWDFGPKLSCSTMCWLLWDFGPQLCSWSSWSWSTCSWSMNHLEKYFKSNMLQEQVLNATASAACLLHTHCVFNILLPVAYLI